ncbi:MAG: aldolase/citrate lyase family protein [Pseudomonadota bacterium]|nr:aldolase/citrate lyase family protein [Pseudomonadota bacterium]
MRNILKEKLASGELCIGGWLTVLSPVIAEAMATLNFDWVAVDMEHAPVSEGDIQGVFIALEKHGCSPMVRLPSADPYLARRMLDAGAHGIIVPTVEDISAFSDFASHCLYPPKGKRGIGLSRCNEWGQNFDRYHEGFAPVLVPQIESSEGVAAAAEIAELEVTDAVFLGPYDLSGSLGNHGNFESAEFKDAVVVVRDACTAAGKPAGIHQVAPDLKALQTQISSGFRFVAYGTDMISMRTALELPKDIK